MTSLKPRIRKILIASCILLAVFGVGVYAYYNTDLKDVINNIGYAPAKEISDIVTDLELTDKGRTIFYASRPEIENAESFNEHCDSHDEKIAVLGCYTKKKIYLHRPNTDELNGVIESTSAHELLHAAWERLSENDKARLTPELKSVYEKYYDALSEDLSIYDDSAQVDELHSRIGTQIPFNNLTKTLKDHYQTYFKNYDVVIAFYNDYIGPFRELQEERDELKQQLEDEQTDIDYRSQIYYEAVEKLSKKIDEFNNCANTTNCFRSEAAFNARRAELVAEQQQLEDEYNSINDAIEAYNKKVEQYNNSVLRTQDLENSINSNVKIIERINQ